ncbi:hypothetical protein FHS18_002284 [Paenibacillus phyllosphaerae]|uniref:Lipoprotein n=1 Tax=Paenibacillus phyllosphaerae TaxID=274593 RepID=A0A7W5FML8_9BACL|nr:hypothetical protein [Paenibacillus phyllosphaerae]MBB3110217.1 hypothetical protein [Paenibacillus phyllosphaerae]
MRKTTGTSLLLVVVILLLAACSSNATSGADAAKEKQIAYTAAKQAEDKVYMLFSKTVLEDGTTVLDATTGMPEKAKALLANYFDESMTAKVMDHYITDQKNGDQVVTNAAPFFSASILATKSSDEVAIEQDDDTFTITTPDGGVFTLRWNKDLDRYLVTDYVQK